MFVSLKAD